MRESSWNEPDIQLKRYDGLKLNIIRSGAPLSVRNKLTSRLTYMEFSQSLKIEQIASLFIHRSCTTQALYLEMRFHKG